MLWTSLTLVFVVTAGIVAAIFARPVLAARRRRRAALSPDQARRLADAVPLYPRLPTAARERLARRTAAFLSHIRFVGCDGIEIDETMRLAVAGQACLLCLRDGADVFPWVREILIYPDAFWVHHEAPDELGLVDDEPRLLAGEAWDEGRVILSWSDISEALAGADHNVVVHEFAHQLDFDAPGTVGAPALADYGDWAAAFGEAYEQLRREGSPVIDPYGAENPAEFFAVAAEAFVQRPDELAAAHPRLYRVLADYLTIDPARR
ncbi:hypothetical protein PC39_11742 [Salinisphaera sp. PC39]|uniref:M90 family metallopeptidase n=1 Tax=Salinisphaera sp. PC39 TaxID=1304156 RepID=UPI00333ED282